MTTALVPARVGGTGAEATASGRSAEGQLPAWPLVAALLGLPVWWILGLGLVAWPAAALAMAAYLLVRGGAKVPAGLGLWAAFLLWMALSAVMVDTGGRMAGFVLRATGYVAAGIVFVYVYNASRRNLSFERIARLLTGVWVIVVAGGWLAMADAARLIRTPSYAVLLALADRIPGLTAVINNDLVYKVIVVPVAQFNPQSAEYAFPRPAAPFTYTNSWGSAYAMLLPFVLVTIQRTRHLWSKVALIAVLVSSLAPAYFSQNRGMLLSLGVGLLYAGIRLGLAGHRRAFLATAGMIAAAAMMTIVVPVGSLISERLSESSTNASRLALYEEAMQRVMQSPLIGYGSPRPSLVNPELDSVGTQGQVWMVLFSHGFPALLLFVGFFVWALVATFRSGGDDLVVWGHAAILIATMQLPFYGMWSGNLMLFMVIAAATVRQRALNGTKDAALTARPTVSGDISSARAALA